ncbi:9413_t:CDS:2 [Entrophospora sp. SA101]|nr:9413_t:CDS:2 [Entrophospora sp. SA101]
MRLSQFEESKVSDSSGSDFILSDEIYSSDSNSDKFIGITVDNDDVDFGEKQDPKVQDYLEHQNVYL